MDAFTLIQPANISFGEFLLSLLIIFFMIVFFVILFQVLVDLFRSHDISGWGKAGWLLFIVVFPFLGLLVYLIVRGHGMAERQMRAAKESQAAFDEYIQQAAAAGGPAHEIAKAKELLDSGAITQDEFEEIKRKQLA